MPGLFTQAMIRSIERLPYGLVPCNIAETDSESGKSCECRHASTYCVWHKNVARTVLRG